MGDRQDRQDDAESVSLPEESAPTGQTDVVPDDRAAEAPVLDGPDEDGTDMGEGLTGVLAALGEPETEPVNAEIAALQADLESDGTEAEIAEGESDSAVELAEPPADIAPGASEGEQAVSEDVTGISLPDARVGVPLWPFILYFVLWVVFAGLLVWQSTQIPAGTPVYELELYGISILVGLGLTVLGPLLAIAVWFLLWLSRPGSRAGLFSRSLIIGAVATLGGVAVWLIALGAVDMLRLGRLL
jgi:hypothetical protein